MLETVAATGSTHRQAARQAGSKLKKLAPALEAMGKILERRWLDGNVRGTTAAEQLEHTAREDPDFARLVQEAQYKSYRTLWDHLVACVGARMRVIREVAPRDNIQAQRIAREMVGAAPVGWPLRGLRDLAHLADARQMTDEGWVFDMRKLHPFVVFVDNLSVSLYQVPKRKGIFIPRGDPTGDPAAPVASAAAHVNPLRGKDFGSMPTATWYHCVNEELGAWSDLLHSGE